MLINSSLDANFNKIYFFMRIAAPEDKNVGGVSTGVLAGVAIGMCDHSLYHCDYCIH